MCDDLWVAVPDDEDGNDRWFLGPKSAFDEMGLKDDGAQLYCHRLDSLYWEMHVDVYDPDIPF